MSDPLEQPERLLSLQEFNRLKFERIIPIYEVGVSRAQIAYWRREGLLLFIEKGKWGKVSCVDAIWLMLLDSLKSFGVSTDTMKKLTYYFLERAYEDDVPRKNLLHNKTVLEKRKKLVGTLDDEDQTQLNHINDVLQNEILLYAYRWDINYFSNLITHSIVTGAEAAILLFHDGQIVEQVFGAYNTYPKKEIDFSAPHIRLSLNYFLKEFVAKESLSEVMLLSQLYSKEEKEVLREIKNKNVREVVIYLSGGKIQRIESTRDGQLSGEQAKEIRRILGLKNYERLTLDTRDEKTISFKRTKKKIK